MPEWEDESKVYDKNWLRVCRPEAIVHHKESYDRYHQ